MSVDFTKEDKLNIGIFGFGEVGRAIAHVYQNNGHTLRIRDLERNDGLKDIDVLNICIPYSKNFVQSVVEQIHESSPALTIIHSTVESGTTQAIHYATSLPVVHSPVRGIHPDLYNGIMTFEKYVGADFEKDADLALAHLTNIGLRVTVFMNSKTTEVGKLFSTTYYGLVIAWHGEMKKICDVHGISFDDAVTHFNTTYNRGYEDLDVPNVVRPVLYPPDQSIGGHCILSNKELLKKHFESLAFNLIDQYDENYD